MPPIDGVGSYLLSERVGMSQRREPEARQLEQKLKAEFLPPLTKI